MKICILTQPLATNYGGLLQAHALQRILKDMGHDVWTENRISHNTIYFTIKQKLRSLLEKLPYQHFITKVYYPTSSEKNIICKNTNEFIKKYITTTIPIKSTNKNDLKSYGFDAYIVGSDQVWRPSYSLGLENYFLDFTKGLNVKRIAYAASFGTSEWEFTAKQSQTCSNLLKDFDAVSVREKTGISLCQEHFATTPEWVLDPTLLLNKDYYIKMVENNYTSFFSKKLYTYILDSNSEKEKIIAKCSNILSLEPFSVMPEKSIYESGPSFIQESIIPPVFEWLRGFIDAEFIITDSFHGVVFSIIFNKNFVAIGNAQRGLDRFTSILELFGLENRLIFSIKDISKELLQQKIDYEKINEIKKRLQCKSIAFLKSSLQ